MTTKEKFLQNIKNRIKVLQDAYDYNKNLPDDVFEFLGGDMAVNGYGKSLNGSDRMSNVVGEIPVEQLAIGYGSNKKLIREIISGTNDGIQKQKIIEQFSQTRPGEKKEVIYNIVTNALAAMAKDGEIVKYKPTWYKGPGFFWKMAN